MKIYEWERQQFKREHSIEIKAEYRFWLTRKLLDRFGLRGVRVKLSTRGWGRFRRGEILLPKAGYRCPLSMVQHEIAHAYNNYRMGGSGHTGTFKRALIKIVVESRKMIRPIFNEIRTEMALDRTIAERERQKQAVLAQRRVLQAKERKTPSFKIAHLTARIKRLESRQKRIGTLIKSAKRSLQIYERMEIKNQTKDDNALAEFI